MSLARFFPKVIDTSVGSGRNGRSLQKTLSWSQKPTSGDLTVNSIL